MSLLETFMARVSRLTTLTPEEKSSGREMLRSYMALRPIRAARPSAPSAPARRAWFALPAFGRAATVASLVVAVVLSGAGVSYAAEGALPGDALYPVKVSVNEEVRAALAVTPAQKADWETVRAERRLEEAETLAGKGTLAPDTGAALAIAFKKHADKARQEIVAMKGNGQDDDARIDASAKLSGSLKAHARIIDSLGHEQDGRVVKGLAASVSATIDADDAEDAADARTDAATTNTSATAGTGQNDASGHARSATDGRVTRRHDAAVRLIAVARATLAGKAGDAAADGATSGASGTSGAEDAQAALDRADAAVRQGDASAASGDASAAIAAYVDAQGLAQEAITLQRAKPFVRTASRDHSGRGGRSRNGDGRGEETGAQAGVDAVTRIIRD